MPNTIHQEIIIPASPQRIYEALTDSKQFSELTEAPAEIGKKEGELFSCFGGMITGRQLELVPGQLIVQAWRVGNWDAGIYSIVRFEFKVEGSETRLIFDHSGFPPDNFNHLESGWHKMYWDNLRKFLA